MMVDVLYLTAAVCFIFALGGLSRAESAQRGNLCGIFGMAIACVAAYLSVNSADFWFILIAIVMGGGIGVFIARAVSMTALPQMVAGFHSLVGLAAVLISFSACFAPELFRISTPSGIKVLSLLEMGLGSTIGSVTFIGSLIAFLKLQGIYKGHSIPLPLNAFFASSICCLLFYFTVTESEEAFLLLTMISLLFGATLIMPVGGADMPVVVSMLNSYSGWATSGIGFTIGNHLLIITGALVGSSGAILSYIMCRGMNRSLWSVIFAPEQAKANDAVASGGTRAFKSGAPEDAAFILKNANSVIVVPGYGMATSKAQYALKELGDMLKKDGISVKYAIHPVAGRMPGHMNVLLAEADVRYDDVFELEEINRDFSSCDVAYVVGANDVVNPAAKNDPSCSIYGMPILEAEKAKIILFLKRSMGTGYAGIDNELFYASNTMVLLGDAKKTTEDIIKAMRE
ncbi:MAG: NAD(P)(+) transhydrogenase (Re/Si-specific) subunit beta [Holosporaceae bacterium]|jgi:NAD(P) transhydrogenase subunit beta|nr:NAD(P)(+) transhydrogenase (Re/Si-specific) subunit beta [Holosporaceae bacterium]